MIEPLKSLFPDRNLNPQRIRMSVISYWLNVRKIPTEDVMLLSGQKWPSSVEMYRVEDSEEQRKTINKNYDRLFKEK
ncbi:MAG: hypothetical protein C0594_14350 [Marinilabiliales bacterium]|nr:MAG: hypothetical protein C0594_14350 [Marinilabiliales bacterium]